MFIILYILIQYSPYVKNPFSTEAVSICYIVNMEVLFNFYNNAFRIGLYFYPHAYAVEVLYKG